jgi:antirestriction protein ArdC
VAHEAVHSTGHGSRLDRTFGKRFGDNAYAAEELVAELGAAFWCGEHGITQAPRPDHAAYLSHWLQILRADAKALVTVSSKAQAAVDYLNRHAATASAPMAEVAA